MTWFEDRERYGDWDCDVYAHEGKGLEHWQGCFCQVHGALDGWIGYCTAYIANSIAQQIAFRAIAAQVSTEL